MKKLAIVIALIVSALSGVFIGQAVDKGYNDPIPACTDEQLDSLEIVVDFYLESFGDMSFEEVIAATQAAEQAALHSTSTATDRLQSNLRIWTLLNGDVYPYTGDWCAYSVNLARAEVRLVVSMVNYFDLLENGTPADFSHDARSEMGDEVEVAASLAEESLKQFQEVLKNFPR